MGGASDDDVCGIRWMRGHGALSASVETARSKRLSAILRRFMKTIVLKWLHCVLRLQHKHQRLRLSHSATIEVLSYWHS
jgi:hypothetical protein